MAPRIADSANPELLHLTSSDAALAEFDTEEALATIPAPPPVSPAVAPQAGKGSRRTLSALTVVAVAEAVTLVLLTTGTRRETAAASPSTTPGSRGEIARTAPLAAEPASQELSGSWSLTSRIADTSVPRFRGLVLRYDLRLEQNGHQLRGAGVKSTENGRALPSRTRTPISLEGTIDGQAVHLDFAESGLARTSRGAFSLRLATDGSLAGGFWSDAARSSGTVTATRRE